MTALIKTPMLTVSAIAEHAQALASINARAVRVIERLQRDAVARRTEIVARWAKTRASGMQTQMSVLQGLEAQEVRQALVEVRASADDELDGLLREAGKAHAAAVGQRVYYASPVQVLARQALGSERRTAYSVQLRGAGPAELAAMGQLAVGTSDVALAAAVLSRLDQLPRDSRPFTASELANAVGTDEHRKAAEYIAIAEHQLQATVVAIRAWRAGRSSPLSTVGLAMQRQALDPSLLEELENADRG